MNGRLLCLIGSAIILVVEIIIGMYVHDRSVRPRMGDALVVVLTYCFIWIFILRDLSQLPSYAFAFACLIEVLQYFQLADVLGIANPATRIILGSTFNLENVVGYTGGYVLVLLVERFWDKKGK